MSDNRAIGQADQLPWHLPNDLKHFKAVTMGKPIIMGRTTYESIGKPLPGRTNIILTRQTDFAAQGCVVLHDKQSVFEFCKEYDEIMIVGGAQIYQLFLPDVTTFYLTLVHADISGDAFFPEYDTQAWREVEREKHLKDNKHEFDYSFIKLERK